MGQARRQDQNCHSNLHHVYPRSRIPRKYRAKLVGKRLTIRVPIRAHNYFHTIFGNRVPEEQIGHLREMCDKNGVLNFTIYNTFKACFDEIFGGQVNFEYMVEILKRWDLPKNIKVRCSDKLVEIRRVMNHEIAGGICINRFISN